MDKIVKDPDFPLQHADIGKLQKPNEITQIVKTVKDSDLLITDNGETVAYLVSPSHYEALVNHWYQTNAATVSDRFLQSYAETHGSLERLDRAYEAAERGEWASSNEVENVFGD